jgi:hypothetical protein
MTLLSVKKYVVNLIDTRVKSLNFREQVSNDVPSQTSDNAKAGKVKREEALLCHFLGVAYPNTPATREPRIER